MYGNIFGLCMYTATLFWVSLAKDDYVNPWNIDSENHSSTILIFHTWVMKQFNNETNNLLFAIILHSFHQMLKHFSSFYSTIQAITLVVFFHSMCTARNFVVISARFGWLTIIAFRLHTILCEHSTVIGFDTFLHWLIRGLLHVLRELWNNRWVCVNAISTSSKP